jgi:hypothetical protein
VHLDFDARGLGEALLEQQRAGAKFVHAGRMAGPAGNEDDLLVGGTKAEGQHQGGEESENFHGWG